MPKAILMVSLVVIFTGCYQPSTTIASPDSRPTATTEAGGPETPIIPIESFQALNWTLAAGNNQSSVRPFEITYDGRGLMLDEWGHWVEVDNFSFSIPLVGSPDGRSELRYTYHFGAQDGWFVAYSEREKLYTKYGDSDEYPGLPPSVAAPFLFVITHKISEPWTGGHLADGFVDYRVRPVATDVDTVNDCNWFGIFPGGATQTEFFVCMTNASRHPEITMWEAGGEQLVYTWNDTKTPSFERGKTRNLTAPVPPSFGWQTSAVASVASLHIPPVNETTNENLLREMGDAIVRDPRFVAFGAGRDGVYLQSAAWYSHDRVGPFISENFGDVPLSYADLVAAYPSQGFDATVARSTFESDDGPFISQPSGGANEPLVGYQSYSEVSSEVVPFEWIESYYASQGLVFDLRDSGPAPTHYWKVGPLPSMAGYEPAESAWGLLEPCLTWDEDGELVFEAGNRYYWASARDGRLLIQGESFEGRLGCAWIVPGPESLNPSDGLVALPHVEPV